MLLVTYRKFEFYYTILTQLNVVSLNNVLLISVQGRKSESTLQSRLSEFDGTKGQWIIRIFWNNAISKIEQVYNIIGQKIWDQNGSV